MNSIWRMLRSRGPESKLVIVNWLRSEGPFFTRDIEPAVHRVFGQLDGDLRCILFGQRGQVRLAALARTEACFLGAYGALPVPKIGKARTKHLPATEYRCISLS